MNEQLHLYLHCTAVLTFSLHVSCVQDSIMEGRGGGNAPGGSRSTFNFSFDSASAVRKRDDGPQESQLGKSESAASTITTTTASGHVGSGLSQFGISAARITESVDKSKTHIPGSAERHP